MRSPGETGETGDQVLSHNKSIKSYIFQLVVHNSWTSVKIKKEMFIGTIPSVEEHQMLSPSAPPGKEISLGDISLQPTIPQGCM